MSSTFGWGCHSKKTFVDRPPSLGTKTGCIINPSKPNLISANCMLPSSLSCRPRSPSSLELPYFQKRLLTIDSITRFYLKNLILTMNTLRGHIMLQGKLPLTQQSLNIIAQSPWTPFPSPCRKHNFALLLPGKGTSTRRIPDAPNASCKGKPRFFYAFCMCFIARHQEHGNGTSTRSVLVIVIYSRNSILRRLPFVPMSRDVHQPLLLTEYQVRHVEYVSIATVPTLPCQKFLHILYPSDPGWFLQHSLAGDRSPEGGTIAARVRLSWYEQKFY